MVADVDGAAVPSKVAVVGANGTMGSLVTRIIAESEGFELFAAIGSRDPLSGMDGADIVVDFTLPQVSQAVVDHAVEQGIAVVIGTSGWSHERIESLARAVEKRGSGAIVVPNFSVGSVLGSHFASLAARYFDSIEIVEAHHAGKIDSPSGTAVRTAEAIGAARADLGPVSAPHVDQRARGQQVASVPVHSLRLRGLLAKQEVLFGGVGEVLTITHDTYSSDAYVGGIKLALAAARSVSGVVVGLGPLLGLDLQTPVEPGARIADRPTGQAASTAL